MGVGEIINGWTEDALKRRVVCEIECCVSCGFRDLKWCDIRARVFLAVVAMWVMRYDSYVVRFKCARCAKRMTQLPPFAVPRGRYIKETILEKCETYTTQPKESYQSAVEGVYYASEGIDDRMLSRSTLWHWVKRLGEMTGPLKKAKELIRAKLPSHPLHRKEDPIPEHKHRCKTRKRVLTVARSVVLAERVFVALFGESLFPRFATT